ncbi:MAG TPA: hypothetical protein VNT03_03150 [Baekduia sp.]|nr:hypothetical protein [Baekduia sp.]
MFPRCLVPLALLVVVLAPAASAAADEPVGASAQGTAIVADAGYAAWRADDGRIVVRAADGAPRVTSLRPPRRAIFDVGAKAGGGAQLVYTERCSTRSHACVVRSAALTRSGTLSARVIAHISYRGGGSPAVAVDGSRLAYAVHGTTVGSGSRHDPCDVPYVRTLSARGGSARRLDRGRCAGISQLDVGDGYVAVLAHPAITYGSGESEARIVRVGGGRSRTLQRESQGEESNYIGALAIDRRALYTARGGIRQANVFTRFRLGSRARSEARAFVRLEGAFARDRGRNSYAQTVSFESSTECGCILVAGSDPFAAGTRSLVPDLGLTVVPQPVFTDSAPSAVATLTRRTVTRTAQVGGASPVAGVAVELLSSTPTSPTAAAAPAPTGAVATTGADGTATIPIPGSPTPRRYLAAVTRPPAGGVAIPTSQQIYLQTYVHMTATASRLPDGRLRVSGAISPAQPGRRVRLDRRLDRICNANAAIPGRITSPQQAGVPAGCFDRYTQDPVVTADVSADGTSYILDAPASAPAGTYSVSLNSPAGVPVYAGETPGIAAP